MSSEDWGESANWGEVGNIIVDDYEAQFNRLVAKWIAKGKQPSDAEDLAQEAIMKSLEASAEDKARSYLDSAATSIEIDRYRKMKGVELVEMEEWHEPLTESLEAGIERSEALDEMYRRINTRLTPENSQIMLLVAQGDTMEEIGEQVGLSVSAVEARVHKSKEKLR